MLTKEGIANFTASVVPFFHLTSRIPGKKHDGLLREKGFGGFPTLCIMDASGEVLHRLRYEDQSLEGFARAVANTQRLLDLAVAAKTDPSARKEFVLVQFDMHKLNFDDGAAAIAALDLSDTERPKFEAKLVETLASLDPAGAAERVAGASFLPSTKARAEEILGDLEIKEAMRPLMRGFRPGDQPPWDICYDLWKAGKIPSGKPRIDTLYWNGVLRHADKQSDAEAYAAAAAVMLPTLTDNEGYAASIRKRLAELQKR